MPARGPRARRGPAAASVAERSRVCARFLLRARVFRGPVVVSGCRNVFRGRAVVFHFRQSRRRGSLSSSLRLIRSLSTSRSKRSWLCAAQNFQAGGALQLNANSKSSPKPLGLLHEALLSGRSFLRAETRSYSLPLQRVACRLPICLVRCSPIFAVRHLLRRSCCARLAFAVFDLLSCAGVEADSW